MTATKMLRLERPPESRMQEQLLEAALRVFARRGYRTARLDDVAEAAGVTKGAIYHYFATKEALLLRVVEHYQALAFGRAEDALRDARLPAAVRIRMLVRKVFARRERHTSDHLLALLIRGVAHEVPHVHDRWLRDGPSRLWTLLGALVDEGKARGEFRPDADGEVAARILVSGLMLQLMWQQHAGGVPALAIESDRLIDSSVELFLAALRRVPVGKRGAT
jgi:AcrR family transcriptional regulator